MNAALLARLRFIDLLLEHYGSINRCVIKDYFGLSTPQASHDLGQYKAQAPGNMIYDPLLRTYRRSPTYKRTFL